jgi:DNA-binding transcriptional regulator YiaG
MGTTQEHFRLAESTSSAFETAMQEADDLRDQLAKAPPTPQLIELLREVGLGDADIAIATTSSEAAVRTWREGRKEPRRAPWERLDALRLLVLELLNYGTLDQPEGTGRWIRAKRLGRDRKTVVTGLQQIADDRLLDAILDAEAMLTQASALR